MGLYFETPIERLRLGEPARGNVGDPCAAASPGTGSGELLRRSQQGLKSLRYPDRGCVGTETFSLLGRGEGRKAMNCLRGFSESIAKQAPETQVFSASQMRSPSDLQLSALCGPAVTISTPHRPPHPHLPHPPPPPRAHRTRPQRSGGGWEGITHPLIAQACSVVCLAPELHFPLGN